MTIEVTQPQAKPNDPETGIVEHSWQGFRKLLPADLTPEDEHRYKRTYLAGFISMWVEVIRFEKTEEKGIERMSQIAIELQTFGAGILVNAQALADSQK